MAHNKPEEQTFPESFDFRDGKKTVLRLNQARIMQMREQNRSFLRQLKEMSADVEQPTASPDHPQVTAVHSNLNALKKTANTTAEQTAAHWVESTASPMQAQQDSLIISTTAQNVTQTSRQLQQRGRHHQPVNVCTNEACLDRRAGLRNEIAIL